MAQLPFKRGSKKVRRNHWGGNARQNFIRGNYFLFELKLFQYRENSGRVPNEGEIIPAGKTDGQYQIYYYLVSADMPTVYLEIQQAYIDGYNEHMRLCGSHPEWFDKNGYRIPMHELNSNTNASSPAI